MSGSSRLEMKKNSSLHEHPEFCIMSALSQGGHTLRQLMSINVQFCQVLETGLLFSVLINSCQDPLVSYHCPTVTVSSVQWKHPIINIHHKRATWK